MAITATGILLRIPFSNMCSPKQSVSFVPKRNARCRCNSNEQRPESLKEALSGMVEERVGELFNNQENSFLLDGLQEATLRVENAKRELAEYDRRQMETMQSEKYMNHLKAKASEIEECEREIIEAKAMVEEAEQALSKGKSEDRLESIKAGAIAGVVGTLAGLPFSVIQASATPSHLLLPTAVTFVSSALFGVTYRYAVRKDLDDFHLKTGTAIAFGLVRGLAMLETGPPLELELDSVLTHASTAAVLVSQSLLIFLFASVALDYFIKLRLLSSFPVDR